MTSKEKPRRCRRCPHDHAKNPHSAEVLECKAASAAHMRAMRAKQRGERGPADDPEAPILPMPPAVPAKVAMHVAPAKWKPTRTHNAIYSIGMPKDGLAAWMLDPELLPKCPPGRARAGGAR